MTNNDLLRLMTWLSPSFPVGGFAWSNGLETVCQNGFVSTPHDLHEWIVTGLTVGSLRNDAIFLTAAHRDPKIIQEINALALALAGSAERFHETTDLGDAFLKAAKPWVPDATNTFEGKMAYPVSVGWVASNCNIPLQETLVAYLHSMANNQIQAALRLMKLGQYAGVNLLSQLEPLIVKQAKCAVHSTLKDIGSNAISMDIASMNHEYLQSRIFKS